MEFQKCSAYATGCDSHVLYVKFVTCLQSCAQWFEAKCGNNHDGYIVSWAISYISDIMMSYDSHRAIPKVIASIVVAFVPMYRDCWLA